MFNGKLYKAVVSEPSKADKKLKETTFKVGFRKHTRDFCQKVR